MSQITKVAISLPREVLEAVEDARRARGESRSQFFRRAAEALLSEGQQKERALAYTRGYQDQPEGEEEIAAARGAAAVLAAEPWE